MTNNPALNIKFAWKSQLAPSFKGQVEKWDLLKETEQTNKLEKEMNTQIHTRV